MITGSCLCGTVRWAFDAPLDMLVHCHCSMCRKNHAAAFSTFAGGPADALRWISGQSAAVTYTSSAQGHRTFCGTCGAKVPAVVAEGQMAFMPAGNLEGDLGLKPQMHLFAGSKAPWHEITDALPQYAEYPPEFGARGIARPAPPACGPGLTCGSCLCGDVTYEVEGPPARMYNCYCARCRKARSAAYATNSFYAADRFRWRSGEAKLERFALPGAQYFGTTFCGRCGSPMPRVFPERGIAVVSAGTLDGDPGARPSASIYVASKAAWVDITDGLPQYAEGMPS
jgi:hypothetical protein